jgi:hypothetical protein
VPEYGKRVLLYMKAPAWGDKQIHIGCRTHTDASGDHWNVDYGHYISHWMPLPELPREYIDMQVTSLSGARSQCVKVLMVENWGGKNESTQIAVFREQLFLKSIIKPSYGRFPGPKQVNYNWMVQEQYYCDTDFI